MEWMEMVMVPVRNPRSRIQNQRSCPAQSNAPASTPCLAEQQTIAMTRYEISAICRVICTVFSCLARARIRNLICSFSRSPPASRNPLPPRSQLDEDFFFGSGNKKRKADASLSSSSDSSDSDSGSDSDSDSGSDDGGKRRRGKSDKKRDKKKHKKDKKRDKKDKKKEKKRKEKKKDDKAARHAGSRHASASGSSSDKIGQSVNYAAEHSVDPLAFGGYQSDSRSDGDDDDEHGAPPPPPPGAIAAPRPASVYGGGGGVRDSWMTAPPTRTVAPAEVQNAHTICACAHTHAEI
jgi:hypothetical protein